jgi:hypothetical protein
MSQHRRKLSFVDRLIMAETPVAIILLLLSLGILFILLLGR